MLSPKIPVAQEGYPFIGFAALLTLVAAMLSCSVTAWLLMLVTTFILCFFRDPERFTPPQENALVSPADGKIIIVETVNDSQFTEGQALKVSIFMNVFNVHVNRVPYSGTIEKIIYTPGKFYAADSSKGALQNEYCAAVMRTEHGKKIAFVQVAGLIARRIICWLEPNDCVVKGRRFGLIRFGSRVDLYLPPDTDLTVRVGEKVRAGESVLGYLR